MRLQVATRPWLVVGCLACTACDLLQQQPHTTSGCTDQQQKLYSECHQLFVKYDGNSSYTVVMLNTPKEGISRFTCCMIEIKLYVSLMHTIGLGWWCWVGHCSSTQPALLQKMLQPVAIPWRYSLHWRRELEDLFVARWCPHFMAVVKALEWTH